ncbi:DUF6153 family protein [Microbacterium kunmingense]|uniref:DUF6153 family protein n=1 Tax=Microbacterium kunmingense TaxID=2915939 RepID=UPI0020048522|nr:DUF6153 family protein [Microbacterium kunmingense]
MPKGQRMNERSNAAGGGSASRRWFAVIVVSLLMAGLVGMHALWTGSSTAHTETTSTLIAADSTGGGHDAAAVSASVAASAPLSAPADLSADCAGCATVGSHDVAAMCVTALILIVLLAVRALPREVRIGVAAMALSRLVGAMRASARPSSPDLTALSISRT